uniref:Uncharacterized protein n=1 Tax=Nelumbo nucifera TaxID=4432 RepID=A0A822YIL2_NELNU|nr:TPA_asm: hypothetical protein HUJ06_011271 [Nelumbo nucifera]
MTTGPQPSTVQQINFYNEEFQISSCSLNSELLDI